MTGIPFAATIRNLRAATRKAAADYAAHPEPQVAPTDEEKRTAVRAVLAGRITRRAVAEILGVHVNTVAAWVKDEQRREGAK